MRAAVFALMLVIAVSGRAAAADDGDNARPFESRPTTIYGVAGLRHAGRSGRRRGGRDRSAKLVAERRGPGGERRRHPKGRRCSAGWSATSWPSLQSARGSPGGKCKWYWDWASFYDTTATKSGTVAWGNVEIGAEIRTRSGFALRYFGGYGHIIAGNLICDPHRPPAAVRTTRTTATTSSPHRCCSRLLVLTGGS